MKYFIYFIGLLSFTFLAGCENISEKQANTQPQPIKEEFKDYWYTGEAEITSYKLQQARYGEIREGNALLIFVTEDFLPEKQVKTNRDVNKVSVLKLNATKNFNTGIYPYSIMQSTFYPVSNTRHALKVSASIQEWCGQTYTQINNRNGFQVRSHSYFEEEADQDYSLDYAYLENELWTQIRVNPASLPTGEIKVVPSLEYVRLRHIKLKPYKVRAKIRKTDSLSTYSLTYPELEREIKIYFNPGFPYEIEKWEEIARSGFGENAKMLTSKAVKNVRIKSAYWKRNSNKDLYLREKLELD